MPASHIEALRGIGYFRCRQAPRLLTARWRFCRVGGGQYRAFGGLCIDGLGRRPAVRPSMAAGDVSGTGAGRCLGENPDALLCGSYAPVKMAEAADGGYRLSGKWAFASGCENAQWSLCAAILPPKGEGKPVPAFLLVPASEYVIEDTWHVVGWPAPVPRRWFLMKSLYPNTGFSPFRTQPAGTRRGGALCA